jgi:YHS domain-containing protein
MKSRTAISLGLAALCCAAIALIASPGVLSAVAQIQQATSTPPIMPAYDAKGELRLPQDWRRWVFVGSSLGLSYAEGGPATAGMEMFHETLMEPTAYDHFAKTGSFREGTQFVLVLHGTGESVLPARRGRFASALHGVEMAVKDASRRPEGWAYYNFGGMNGIRNTAQAMPKESCYSCHVEHAKRDNVFIQFYPLLEAVAPRPVAAHGLNSQRAHTNGNSPSGVVRSSQADTALALKGLDPVLLSSGQEEMGKPEIIAVHKGRRYQFVSEPHRARFAAKPEKFAIQNDTCPVVAGAPVDPSLFAVHAGKIYAFATADCVQQFKARPAEYVKP